VRERTALYNQLQQLVFLLFPEFKKVIKMLIFQLLKQVFKSIDFYFINRTQQFTQFAFRKAFSGKPDNIWLRKIYKTTSCITIVSVKFLT
jgi:hypothetical protein